MKIITIKEAHKLGLKRYFTGRPCKRGHVSERYYSGGQCIVCHDIKRTEYRQNNKSALREINRIWVDKNRKITNAHKRKWRLNNPEKQKESERKWIAKNPHYHYAKWGRRNAAKLQRSPPWLTKEHRKEMQGFYEEAHRLTEITGIKYSVDHVIPLQGDLISGLHVPWNLQVITLSENSAKNNKWPYNREVSAALCEVHNKSMNYVFVF